MYLFLAYVSLDLFLKIFPWDICNFRFSSRCNVCMYCNSLLSFENECRYETLRCIQIFLSRMRRHVPDNYPTNHHHDGAPGSWLYYVTLQSGAAISTSADSVHALITSLSLFDMLLSANTDQFARYLKSIFIVCTGRFTPWSVYSCHRSASIWSLLLLYMHTNKNVSAVEYAVACVI